MKFTPDEILDAAAQLFDEQGVGVSTAKIAAAAGVSNGTLFNYFPTKQALVDSLYLQLKRELAAALGTPDGTFEAQVRATWNRWLDWGERSPRSRRVSNLLHHSGLASADAVGEASELLGGPVALLEAGRADGRLIDLPVDSLAALIGQQLELALDGSSDPRHRELAFRAMWRSITPATQHNPKAAS